MELPDDLVPALTSGWGYYMYNFVGSRTRFVPREEATRSRVRSLNALANIDEETTILFLNLNFEMAFISALQQTFWTEFLRKATTTVRGSYSENATAK
jgi:hypothetical protein